MAGEDRETGRYASPPCLAAEVAPDYFDPLGVDPEQARDVARWRAARRRELLDARRMVGVAAREAAGAALADHVEAALASRVGDAAGRVLSAYWPIKGELDLRPLMARLHDRGVRIALPVVVEKARPLVFRPWSPGAAMVRGDWNIPIPPPEAGEVLPDIALAPLVGWDGAGYRLGYGGGYFDRTLAALAPRPFTIGVGFHATRLATIYPQPHDIPLDVIVTEAGREAG